MLIFCPKWMSTKRQPLLRRILIIQSVRWCVLGIPPSLFCQAALSSASGLMNKVTMVARLEVVLRLRKHGLTLPKADLAKVSSECLISPHWDQHWIVDIASFSRWPSIYLETGWLHWITSFIEEVVFCYYLNRYILWVQSCLFCTHCFHYHYFL